MTNINFVISTQKKRVLTIRTRNDLKGGNIMKLVPLGDRVVLKQLVAEETTKSGIVLPG